MDSKIAKPCIAVLHYRPLQETVPVMALLLNLIKLGYPVFYISVESSPAREFLEANAIPFHLLPRDNNVYRKLSGFAKLRARLSRASNFFGRRAKVNEILANLKKKYGEVVLWSQEFEGVALVGAKAFNYPRRIITMFEMFTPRSRRWLGVDYARMMQTSTVVLPEYNRAWLYKSALGLEHLPFVIPNKIEPHPRKPKLSLPEEMQKVFAEIGDRPVFLFQGSWGGDRKDIGMVLETLAKNRPQYCVVTMPATEAARQRLSQYPNAYILPFMPAPGHLRVTSHATVGLAFYSDGGDYALQRLNAIYCAPNKIYEYAGFGIPTLGNRLPGLQYSVEAAGAGRCCDLTETSILAAADELVANIETFRKNATAFYEATDLEQLTKQVLDAVCA